MRLTLRTVLAGLIALAVVGWALSGLNEDDPGRIDSSTTATQNSNPTGTVTLVIDFGSDSELKPIIRKVEFVGGTGWDLFEAAGLDVAGTAEFPTGFVCRIEGVPSIANQDCLDTPKFSEGSWSYFVTNSKLGNGWLLSGAGAATHHPECGAFEGWLWVPAGESSGQQLPSVAANPEICEG